MMMVFWDYWFLSCYSKQPHNPKSNDKKSTRQSNRGKKKKILGQSEKQDNQKKRLASWDVHDLLPIAVVVKCTDGISAQCTSHLTKCFISKSLMCSQKSEYFYKGWDNNSWGKITWYDLNPKTSCWMHFVEDYLTNRCFQGQVWTRSFMTEMYQSKFKRAVSFV